MNSKNMTLVYSAIVLLILWLSLLMGGCKKAPINEDVEGLWRLEEFTTLDDGETHRCERLFYSITRFVVEVAEKQGTNGYGAYIGRFAYDNDGEAVVMKEFKQRASTGDNGKDATPEQLMPYGMNRTETTFRIVEADGKRLVLESDYARLNLTAF